MEETTSIITLKILDQPSNFISPKLSIIHEKNIIKISNIDPISEHFHRMESNLQMISKDHMVPGFLYCNEVNKILSVELLSIVVITIVNHMTHFLLSE